MIILIFYCEMYSWRLLGVLPHRLKIYYILSNFIFFYLKFCSNDVYAIINTVVISVFFNDFKPKYFGLFDAALK